VGSPRGVLGFEFLLHLKLATTVNTEDNFNIYIYLDAVETALVSCFSVHFAVLFAG